MYFKRVLTLAMLLLLVGTAATAQRVTKKKDDKKERDYKSSKDKKKSNDGSFKDHLWYGGSFGLGFSGGNGASVFSVGLSPMVGYKIWGPLSLGPRLGFQYSSYKVQGFKAANLFAFEPGVFARSKIFGPVFAHVEAANQWTQYVAGYDINTSKPIKESVQYLNQYVGLGYNNGDGGVGTELLVLYNVAAANDINYPYSPWDLRFGLTWKF